VAIETDKHDDKILNGKVCMVTGATSGIGLVAARAFAKMGAELFLVCRNSDKGERTVANIIEHTGNDKITLLLCDLSSLTEVRNVAQSFLSYDRPLHILLNNAGVVNLKREITADNHEKMFAVNHLAHFLLTNLLLDRIKASTPARIVNVASEAHWFCKGINFEDLTFNKKFRALKVYGHSKLANILFSKQLAKRVEGSGVTVNAIHPGGFGISTALGSQNGRTGKIIMMLLKPFLQSPGKGAITSIYACTSPDLDGVTGRYLKNCCEIQPKPWALDGTASQQLWEVSEKLTNLPKRASS